MKWYTDPAVFFVAATALTCSSFAWLIYSTTVQQEEARRTAPLRTFKLHDGSIVQCKSFWADKCGAGLSRCVDGAKYSCQSNVVELP